MEKKDILLRVDHTILKQTTTLEDIYRVCDEAIANNCASVCIPPCYVWDAYKYVEGKKSICTVIGFPNGYSATSVKVAETVQAIEDGASEIDMVINIGYLKSRAYGEIAKEIKAVADVCHTNERYAILKVIIETCLLTEKEIRDACKIIAGSGADYVKTSTGFSTSGATKEAIEIIVDEVKKLNQVKELREEYPMRDRIRVKASGGIKDFNDAEMFISLGCERLGTSRLIS